VALSNIPVISVMCDFVEFITFMKFVLYIYLKSVAVAHELYECIL
jgi:hypothetical protein